MNRHKTDKRMQRSIGLELLVNLCNEVADIHAPLGWKQALKVIKIASALVENINYNINIVNEDPRITAFSLNASGILSPLPDEINQFIGERADMVCGSTGHIHIIIGYRAYTANIIKAHIRALLFKQELNYLLSKFERRSVTNLIALVFFVFDLFVHTIAFDEAVYKSIPSQS